MDHSVTGGPGHGHGGWSQTPPTGAIDAIDYVTSVELVDGTVIEQTYKSSALGSEVLAGLLEAAQLRESQAERWTLELQGWPGFALPMQLPLRRINAFQVCRQIFGCPKLRAARARDGVDASPIANVVKEQLGLEFELARLVPAMADFARLRAGDSEMAEYRAHRAVERRSSRVAPSHKLCKYTECEALPRTIAVLFCSALLER